MCMHTACAYGGQFFNQYFSTELVMYIAVLPQCTCKIHLQGLTLRFLARGPKRLFDKFSGQKQDFCIIIYYFGPLV